MTAFFAGIFAALAFGTIWGWIILVVAFIVITALVENDKGFWAFLGTLLSVILLCGGHFDSALHFIAANPGKVVLMILSYFVLGTVWSILKWFLYVNRQLEKYNERKAHWLHNENLTAITTSEQALDFKRHLGTFGELSPQVREHKSDILLWMTYWPFSCLWTLINDPIRKIFRTIYVHITTSLQAISDRMFKGVVADLELAKEAEDAEKERRAEAIEKAQAMNKFTAKMR